MTTEKRALKKAKLRHAEYYDFQDIQDRLYRDSKDGKEFCNLIEVITMPENIRMAYRNLKKNHGSHTPGTDKKTINDIEKLSDEQLIGKIQEKFRWYRPQSVRRVEIPKGNGKVRPLGIPTIMDRLVQQCVLQVLEPICEAKFHEHSYGFRPNRSTGNAIAQTYKNMQMSHLHYVVDIDIKGFFDNVNHGKLLKQLWTLGIRDGRELVHKKLEGIDMAVLHDLMRNPIEGESIEFNDNRLSLYSAQKGKCAVTGNQMDADDVVCIRKTPKEQGGTDKYSNLLLVCRNIQKLLYIKNPDTFIAEMEKLNLDLKRTEKLLKLRSLTFVESC